MPTIVITKTYQDGNILNELDLDNIKDDVETFLNVTKLDSDNIQDDGIQEGKLANSVTDGTTLTRNATTKKLEVKDDGIDTLQLAADSVTSDKIAANAVGSSEIAANAVGASEIAANAVGSSEIAAGAVTSSELGTNSVSWIKKLPRGNGSTVSNGDVGDGAVFSISATGTTAILSAGNRVTITTRGGPVMMAIRSRGSQGELLMQGFGITQVPSGEVRFTRAGSDVYRQRFLQHLPTTGDLARLPVSIFMGFDFPPAGTYEYSLELQSFAGRIDLLNAQYTVWEL